MKKYKNILGASMIEMLMYLGLVVVISAGSLKLYGEAVEKTKRIKAENQIRDIAEAVHLIYMGREFMNKTLTSRDLKDTNLVSPWNDTIQVSTFSGGQEGKFKRPYFRIQVNLTKENCIFLGTTLENVASGINPNNTSTTDLVEGVDELMLSCKDKGDVSFFFIKE